MKVRSRTVPMKVSEILRLLEHDGWVLKRVTGSHHHYIHPTKPGLGYRGRQTERDVEAEDRSEHPEAGWTTKGAAMRGYVAVFEGNDDSGYSAYSPDLPGVIAAADTREETEQLMLEAMAQHLALLRELGQPVPEPADSASVTILDPAAA